LNLGVGFDGARKIVYGQIMTVTLTLDTAHAACTVGVVAHGRLVASAQELRARGHAERLVPMVQEVLGAAGNPTISAIVTTLGPGSYTGLRVALAAARAFGLAWRCPVWGVSSLAALAFAAGSAKDVLVAQDAGRGLIFVQAFSSSGAALTSPESLLPADALERAQHYGCCVGGGFTNEQALAAGVMKLGLSDFPEQLAMAEMVDAGLACTDLTPIYTGGTYEAMWGASA
jgi:tRNA threonylcarbamoyladenosine biosynthesis protein TsaB